MYASQKKIASFIVWVETFLGESSGVMKFLNFKIEVLPNVILFSTIFPKLFYALISFKEVTIPYSLIDNKLFSLNKAF